jgi:O-antigen/teichoic acid export membrane protein
VLYAYKSFKQCVVLQLLVDLAKLSAVGILMLTLNLNVSSSVAVFALIPLVGILLGFWQIRNQLFSKSNPIKNLIAQFFVYGKWVFLNKVFAAGFPHIAIFMLAMISTTKTTGVYGLAYNLTYIFPILIVSLQSVLLPEVARFKEIAQIDRYIRGSLKISLFSTACIIPLLFFSDKIILFFFGLRYQNSALIFNWLLLSHIFIVISIPIRSALYTMDKPNIICFVDLFRVTAMIAGCYLLIPDLGSLAPAILAFIINAVALGFFILYIFREIQQKTGLEINSNNNL